MDRIGIIGGTVFFGSDWFSSAQRLTLETDFGPALLLVADRLAFIPRHGLGEGDYLMPHRIPHAANFLALKKLGVQRVIGVNSCGSLKLDLPPGLIAVPEDFISFFNVPSIFQDRPGHITPSLDESLRRDIIDAAGRAGITVHDGGVYWQNSGPRLETKAEIRMMSRFADMVGMTLGSEATLACEVNLAYASLCSLDNYGHGLTDQPLTEAQIRAAAAANAERVVRIIETFLAS